MLFLSDIAFLTGCLCSQHNVMHDTVPVQPWSLAIAVRSWTVESHSSYLIHKNVKESFFFFLFLDKGESRQLWGVFIIQNSLTLLTFGKWITSCLTAAKSLSEKKNAVISQWLLLWKLTIVLPRAKYIIIWNK